MRFRLIDQITEIELGSRLTAVRTLRPEEEYLKDHFPRFPVLPGVLMLEAMFQAAMWLVRRSEDFAHSVVLLKEARNVKFADFVEPGETLTVRAEIVKQDETTTLLKTQGSVDETLAVSGRLLLERYNLGDRHDNFGPVDPFISRFMRTEFERLYVSGQSECPAS
jgi:3-hydroxyacyl-[acyl-carrier-protein] dehydratase